MIEIAPFPLALGNARPPALIAAAEKYFRDRALALAVVTQAQAPYAARELVSGAGPTTPAPGKLAGYSPLGVGMVTDASNSGSIYAAPVALPSTFANASMLWVGVPTGTNTGTSLYCAVMGVSNGDPDIGITYDVTNTRFKYVESSIDSAAVGSSPLGSLYVVVTTKAGTAKKLFVNGVRVSSTSGGAATRSRNALGFGRQPPNTFTYLAGTHVACALWGRTLTDDEATDLSLSLMRSIAAPRRFRPQYTPNAGGSVNVLTDTGSLIATGFAPSIAVSNNQNVLAGLGVATLSGFAPSVVATGNQNVLAGLGLLALTGFAPSVTASGAQNVQPGVGVVSLSGFAPAVATSSNRNVLPGVGAAILSGFAPSVFATNPVTVLPGRGVLSLTGFAPTATVSSAGVPALGRTSLTMIASRSSVTAVASRSAVVVRNSDLN